MSSIQMKKPQPQPQPRGKVVPGSQEDLLALANEMADAAGEIARRTFRQPMAITRKADGSPVTPADREIEGRLRDLIATRFPSHGVIGEEFGRERAEAEHVWVIDPIDGTRAFVGGVPIFTTLIGLLRRGLPILGVIDQPIVRDRWVGAEGIDTTHNGAAVRARECARIEDALLSTTTPDLFAPEERAGFERLRSRARETTYGGDGYAYGLIASGLRDLIVESGLKLWDWAPLVPVLAGAGGALVDWTGRALVDDSSARVIAAGDARLVAPARECLGV